MTVGGAQAEFGLPWAIGVNAEGQAYGRLEFKPKMQQWVLIRPTAADWQRLELGRLLPSMGSSWGSLHPPKSDARWICFPYLAAPPPCTLDLPALMAEGGFADAPLAAPAGPLPVSVLMPEALEQRDVKSIGAKPPTKPSAPKQPTARGARKKKGGRDAEAEPAPRGAAAGGSAKRQRGSGSGSGDAMRDQRAAELLRPSASMEGLLQSLGVRQAFAGFGGGGGGGGGGNPNESHAQQQQRGSLPPSSSLMQLLQALEAQGDGDGAAKLSAAAAAGAEGSAGGGGGSAQDLVNSPSIQSLLGLLRSSSATSLGHLGTDADSRAASMLQLSSLAGQLAASPSAADLLGAAGEHLRRNGSSNAMLANLAALAARGGADGIAAAVAAAAPQLQLQSAGGGSSAADAARGGAGVVGAHGRGMDSAHMPPPAGTPIKLGGAVGEGEVRPTPATAPLPTPATAVLPRRSLACSLTPPSHLESRPRPTCTPTLTLTVRYLPLHAAHRPVLASPLPHRALPTTLTLPLTLTRCMSPSRSVRVPTMFSTSSTPAAPMTPSPRPRAASSRPRTTRPRAPRTPRTPARRSP